MSAAWTDDQLLDAEPGSQPVGWSFALADQFGEIIGHLHPTSEQVVEVSNDTTRSPMREISTFELVPSEAADVNFEADRLAPAMALANGSILPMGTFVFTDATTDIMSWGRPVTATLNDLTTVLAQAVGSAYGVPAGTPWTSAFTQVFELSALTSWEIDAVDGVCGSTMAWTADKSLASIMNDMTQVAGTFPVFCDNNGVGRIKVVPDPAVTVADLVYGTAPDEAKIIDGSFVASSGQLAAPNRWIALDSSGDQAAPIIGVYDLPPTAPNSFEQRGYRITKTLNLQGLGTKAAAVAAAQAQSVIDAAYVTYNWSSPPDARHDTFDAVQIDNLLCTETAWSLPMAAGAEMTHTAQQLWQEPSTG